MATNYVQAGKVLDFVAPYDRTTGQGFQVGSIFAVALGTALSTVAIRGQVDGVWTLAKTSAQAWTVGQKIYWDNSNKRCDSDSTVGQLIGVAAVIAANPTSTGVVRLNGVAPATAEGPQAAEADLTDNSGGAAGDGTIGVVTAPTAISATLTDNSGGSGTHDDTIADGETVLAALVDNSGGAAADGTIGVVTAPTAISATLTDNSGGSGTHDDTIADGLTSTALTADNGGGTADGTVEVMTAAGAITDNSGGVNPGNNIIAAITDPAGSAGMVTYTNVALAAGAAAQLDIAAAAGGETMATLVQPSHPRNIKLTVTDGNASISAFSISVNGKAPDGTAISEVFAFAGGLVQTGSKVFASLTSIVLTSVAGNGAGDTLDAEWGVKLGVPLPYGSTGLSIVKLSVGGTTEAASATDTTNNSFTATSAPDGARDYEIWYEWTGPATTQITAAVAQLAAKQNTTTTAIGAIKNNIKECTEKIAALITDVIVQNQNDSDLAQKVIELVTAQGSDRTAIVALTDAIAEVAARANTLRTDSVVHNQNISDLAQKAIELVTAQAADRTAIVALTDAVKELATKQNAVLAKLRIAGILAA